MDLERGPTGFGFSLRGGSEYNMGLYVLGLMDGGPAQRSNKIQVASQRTHTHTSGVIHWQMSRLTGVGSGETVFGNSDLIVNTRVDPESQTFVK